MRYMADICLLYARNDSARVAVLVEALTAVGWDVWWDKDHHHGEWDTRVESEISNAGCVIPVWTFESTKHGCLARSEAKRAKDIGKPLFPVRLDDATLPIQFNNYSTVELTNWDGSVGHPQFRELVVHLKSILEPASRQWDGTRPRKFRLREKTIDLPCFVRSVSSYETQLLPLPALKALLLYPTSGAVLVSAYDSYLPDNPDDAARTHHQNLISLLEKLDERGDSIFLDSGNYEAFRKGENEDVCKDAEKAWTQGKFIRSLRTTPCTYAFSFDNLSPANDADEIVSDAIGRVTSAQELSRLDHVLPILHVPKKADGSHRSELFPDMFLKVAEELAPPIIAAPEREFGDGLYNRARIVYQIRHQLARLGRYQPIHLLGTGNPISIAIFAMAGADFFDGLEWCRTVADRATGLLYHHQQYDFFRTQTKMSQHDIVREAATDERIDFYAKMAFHNLDVFDQWMQEVQDAISEGSINEMLASYMDKSVFREMKTALPEIFGS